MNNLINELAKQGVEVNLGGEVEKCPHTFGETFTAHAELVHVETGTMIGFCRKATAEEALLHLVAKCVGDVARTKVAMGDCDFINSSDVEELWFLLNIKLLIKI